MDKPISVGDLVVVVRGHECDLGVTYIVGHIITAAGVWSCPCGAREFHDGAFVHKTHSFYGAPVEWLKRIPPLPELESEKNDSKLAEPA